MMSFDDEDVLVLKHLNTDESFRCTIDEEQERIDAIFYCILNELRRMKDKQLIPFQFH